MIKNLWLEYIYIFTLQGLSSIETVSGMNLLGISHLFSQWNSRVRCLDLFRAVENPN